MNKNNIQILFIASICFIIYGLYNVGKASYVKATWDKVDGVVIDFEKNTWSCGKGISECYNLIIGYHVNKNYLTIQSKKTWNYDPPKHLMDEKIPIYYAPGNPSDAIVGGGYGAGNYGIMAILFGVIIQFVLWLLRKRGEI